MEGIQFDTKRNTLWYPTSVIGKHDRGVVIQKCVEYYENSPDARGEKENLKTQKDALYSPNGMSRDRSMRLMGNIPVFIWLLAIRLTGDSDFWQHDGKANQGLFFQMYPAFRTKTGGKGNRVCTVERTSI